MITQIPQGRVALGADGRNYRAREVFTSADGYPPGALPGTDGTQAFHVQAVGAFLVSTCFQWHGRCNRRGTTRPKRSAGRVLGWMTSRSPDGSCGTPRPRREFGMVAGRSPYSRPSTVPDSPPLPP